MTRGRTVVGPRYVVRTLEVCLFLALACSCSAAFDSDRTIAQFAHTAWGPKDGAPSVVEALAQSADGHLWLGSAEGLYRFDGVVFERYQPQSGGPFPVRSVTSLLALPNGDLWIGFRSGGMSLLRNGNTTNYTAREGVPEGRVWGFAQDREGNNLDCDRERAGAAGRTSRLATSGAARELLCTRARREFGKDPEMKS